VPEKKGEGLGLKRSSRELGSGPLALHFSPDRFPSYFHFPSRAGRSIVLPGNMAEGALGRRVTISVAALVALVFVVGFVFVENLPGGGQKKTKSKSCSKT
jgi:hypothetical protein